MLGRHTWFDRHRSRVITLVSLAVGAILWEIIGRFFLDPIFFASFSETAGALIHIVQNGDLATGLLESLQLFAAGFALGTALGLIVGVAVGRIEILRLGLEDYITFLYIMPNIVLIPFILAVIGFGFWPKTLVVVLFVFFPVCFNVIEGVRAISRRLVEVARSFGANEWGVWKDVVIPATVPYAMTGIRQGIARGLVGMIGAEFLLDSSGLGQLLLIYARRYQMDNLLAAVVVVVTIGLVAMAGGRVLETRFSRWRS
ncbi:ABC transporter permease [Phytoactinopolyspora limicola]|uniref:ABC transporter permease n=1 Tax=Phytoactinopolyspora limicola TaxID=2715536 RepID=UPI0014097864|nr:ABC transporter permease subunit [Phytoactinopolyspora limicola]